MTDFYAEFAEQFLNSMAGQTSGLSQSEAEALFRQKFPDEAAFRAQISALTSLVEAKLGAFQNQIEQGGPLPQGVDLTDAVAMIRPKG